jgi:hypothetical protein
MLHPVDGGGWHEAEMLPGTVGFRWSGPGRLSTLRAIAPRGAGRAEALIVLQPGEAPPDIAVFLNGRPVAAAPRRLGAFAVLDIAWDAAAMAGEALAEFWFQSARVMQLPAPGQRMRSVGFRLSTLTIEAAADGPAAGADAPALLLGRRLLAEHLPVATGRPRLVLRPEAGASFAELHLEGARLGPSAQPRLTVALGSQGDAPEVALGPSGGAGLRVALPDGQGITLPAGLSPRDAVLLLRLLTAVPDAFGRALAADDCVALSEVGSLVAWRRRVGALAAAAERALAAALSDGPDPLGEGPFVWPDPVPGG